MDLAIICEDAAEEFIRNNDEFKIVGSCVKNSDVFILKDNKSIKKIGIAQNRKYQQELVKAKFGSSCQVYPMTATALGYALENNTLDAILIDSLKSWKLDGKKEISNYNKDYITYVMVVNKGFEKKDLYKEFINHYNEAIMDLKDEKSLKKQLSNYMNTTILDEEVRDWKKLNVKLEPIIQE
ncbi:ABC transporter substrate-binding (seleno)protein SaoB [Tepidibacter hydrothermalis]|nr:ABC transporter substrate-binding (seleno)protein SaoB [Tepidibacter hydrothermalis]WFD11170.1 ABC transporter substrate-binding (seleno)protein SaoB [Tepidibacter hydrothermalis]